MGKGTILLEERDATENITSFEIKLPLNERKVCKNLSFFSHPNQKS